MTLSAPSAVSRASSALARASSALARISVRDHGPFIDLINRATNVRKLSVPQDRNVTTLASRKTSSKFIQQPMSAKQKEGMCSAARTAAAAAARPSQVKKGPRSANISRKVDFVLVLSYVEGCIQNGKHHKAGPNLNANYHNLRYKQNTLQTLMNKQQRRRSLHNMGGLKKKLGIWKRRLPNSAYICEREKTSRHVRPSSTRFSETWICQMMLFARHCLHSRSCSSGAKGL